MALSLFCLNQIRVSVPRVSDKSPSIVPQKESRTLITRISHNSTVLLFCYSKVKNPRLCAFFSVQTGGFS